MRPQLALTALLLLTVLSASGCTNGLLYTDITVPLTKNVDQTPVGTRTVSLDMTRVTEPFTGIRAEVHSSAIGDAAKQAGLKKVHYVDFRRQSILLGMWQMNTVLVTGE